MTGPIHRPSIDEKRQLLKFILVPLLVSAAVVTTFGGGAYWIFSRDLPTIITVADYRPLSVTRVVAKRGEEDAVVGEFYKERRYVIPFEKIPDRAVHAFISAEDDSFFEHEGINPMAILRASIANFRAGEVVQGGSTITQQVAKSLFLTPERSMMRKAKEAILAARIERNLTKQQILYLYLNQIYLGNGAYGIQAAAKSYFRKDVTELSIGEAALLAGMPKAPGKFSPFLNPKRAKERQLYVLKRMHENGYISESEMMEAASLPLRVFYSEDVNQKYAPYLVEHIRRHLIEKYGDKAVYEDGLTVTLPSDLKLYEIARNAVRKGLREVDKRAGYRGPVKRLLTEEEVFEFNKSNRDEIVRKRVPYQMLRPDGTLGMIEAMEDAEVPTDDHLLEVDELYHGAVVRVDDAAGYAVIQIGNVTAKLPVKEMAWAFAAGESRRQSASRPSDLVKPGDVIQVRVTEVAFSENPAASVAWSPAGNDSEAEEQNVNRRSAEITVALEQDPEVQAALVSIEAETGFVLAMVGGYDFAHSEFNRAIQARRQPGSAYKPIIYTAGLEKGFTPASVIVDSPIVYEDDVYGKWKPSNFEEKFYGDTTFRQAFIHSRNIPTIKLVQNLGIDHLISFSNRIGLQSEYNKDLSISLGSATTTLMDLTAAYAVYPRLGRKLTPVFLTRVINRDGEVLEEHHPQRVFGPQPTQDWYQHLGDHELPEDSFDEEMTADGDLAPPRIPEAPKFRLPDYPLPGDPAQVIDPRVAYVATHLMKEVVNYGTGRRASGLGRDTAGKTGTTNEYKDAWFMGFTPHVVTGTWVGYDDGRSLGKRGTGAGAALPIWVEYMEEAVKRYPEKEFPVPPGIVFTPIDFDTGRPVDRSHPRARTEAFIQGTEPTDNGPYLDEAVDSKGEFLKEDFD